MSHGALRMRMIGTGLVLGGVMTWFQHGVLDRSWPVALVLGLLFVPLATAAGLLAVRRRPGPSGPGRPAGRTGSIRRAPLGR
ncbi:hypothetical protein QNO07_01180 [Streptomyces sp. 549]|uniref:hypothetical protein n=1 Tax=Streptomyces sp. 549 TaxID=3049076 RepID=UPI0024C2290B|nr:hypothetical protein [Streptomyces sp. 549]MDK1472053.1 hypothetical protein [Streptomyces sp. 549]